jgi:hypothetical protein
LDEGIAYSQNIHKFLLEKKLIHEKPAIEKFLNLGKNVAIQKDK